MEKYFRAEHATCDNMVHAHSIAGNLRLHTHTSNSYSFSMATMVAQTYHIAASHVHWLSCLNIFLMRISIYSS